MWRTCAQFAHVPKDSFPKPCVADSSPAGGAFVLFRIPKTTYAISLYVWIVVNVGKKVMVWSVWAGGNRCCEKLSDIVKMRMFFMYAISVMCSVFFLETL